MNFKYYVNMLLKYAGYLWGWAYRGFGLALGVWLFMKLVAVHMVTTTV